ncbi:MAG: hypothetical protein SFV54_22645 [Bryobacteraceae bacterium]|nr:hypothetical protein [Bryobacteraceae bacterium]
MRLVLALVIALAAPAQEAKPVAPNHMFYDPARRQVVMLAASPQTGLETLWAWDGKRWTQIPAGAGPVARELSGAAYDSARRRLVLYGGAAVKPRQGRLEDTWEWDGKRWAESKVLGPHPGPRDHHAMAFDSARGRVVLFGGLKEGDSPDPHTWEWDGARWSKVASTGASGGGGHNGLVYDAARRLTILFAGFGGQSRVHNQTWAWDGKEWRQLSPQGPLPSPRYRHRMAFDSDKEVIVLFGGLLTRQAPAEAGDTWLWDGKQWREAQPAGGIAPAPRASHVMAYDPTRRRTVLYGGHSFDGRTGVTYDDTWEWDGHSWTRAN